MDDEDLGFVEDGEESPDIDRGTSLPSGALVLPGYDVEGAADGTGTTTERGGSATRKRARADITPEIRDRQLAQEARAAGSAGDIAGDTLQAFTGLDVRGGHMGREETQAAQGRTSRRLDAARQRAAADPAGTVAATAYGLPAGATSGLLDELAGHIGAPIAEIGQAIPRALGLGADEPIPSPEEATAAIRAGRERLRGRAPEAMAMSEVVGEAAQMALPPLRAEGTAARVLASGAEGALYGGAHGLGYGDATTVDEALTHAGRGALAGGTVGASFGVPDVALRRALRGMSDPEAARRALDDATLAATGQSGGGITSRTQRFERGESPAARERTRRAAAESLREADVIPAAGTTGQTLDRIQAARRRGFETLEAIATDMGERGATGSQVADRLRQASGADTTAMGSQFRSIAEDMAGRIEERYGNDAIPYAQLMQELARLRDLGAYQTRAGREVSMPREAMGETYDALRGSYDDIVGEALGPERLAEFQGARRRETALRTAEEIAREGTAREAERSSLGGMSGILLGAGGMGGAGAMMGGHMGEGIGTLATGAVLAAGAEAFRRRSPRLRYTAAVSAERMARFLQTPGAQRLGRYASELQQAARRGSDALASTMYVLSQRDADFRELMDSIDFESDPYGQTPAVEAIAGSGEEAQP